MHIERYGDGELIVAKREKRIVDRKSVPLHDFLAITIAGFNSDLPLSFF
jgi:hypothetical protein